MKESLTYIEEKYINAVCSDKTNKELADELCIGKSSIYAVEERVKSKTSQRNRFGIMMYAIKNGIVII